MLHRILPTAPRGGGIITPLCSGGNWHAKRPPWSKEEALKTGSLRTWGSNMTALLHSPCLDGRLQNEISDPPKRKGKSPEPKERVSPFLNSLLRHWHPRVQSHWDPSAPLQFPASLTAHNWPVETIQTTEPTGFFLLELMLKVCRNALIQPELQQGSASNLGGRRRALRKWTRTDGGGKREGARFILKPLTHWFLLTPYYCEIQANRSSQEPPGMQSLGTWFGLIKKKKGILTHSPALTNFAIIPPQRQPKLVL